MKEKFFTAMKKIGKGLKKVGLLIVFGFGIVLRMISYPFRFPFRSSQNRARREPLKLAFLRIWKDEYEGAEELYEYELRRNEEKKDFCAKFPFAPYCTDGYNNYYPM